MLSFLSMANNYDERKIARYDKGGVFVDTCAVSDSDQPYETAVQHKNYNNDKMVIVEMYETKEAAKKGHTKWVRRMTAKKLPASLKDVSTSDVAKLIRSVGGL